MRGTFTNKIWVIFSATFLGLLILYTAAFFKTDVILNKTVQAASSHQTLDSQGDWNAGASTNIDSTLTPGIIQMATKGLTLWDLYQEDTTRVTSSLTDPDNQAILAMINPSDNSYFKSDDGGPGIYPEWWKMDLGSIHELNSIELTVNDGVGSCAGVHVYYSINGTDFTELGSTQDTCATYPDNNWSDNTFYFGTPTNVRYIKIDGNFSYVVPGATVSKILINPLLASATHTSTPTQLDAGLHESVNWTTFVPDGTNPNANTSMSFRFRTSPDASTWSSWSASNPYSASIDLSGLTQQRYLQVESTLTNTDGSSTPTLDSYTANYDYTDAPLPTCIDGIQNGDETGVDCGGSCGACPVPETCIDGIKNQNETDVDCGGVCGACPVPPTCDDGIQNGDETGVDTGGSCPAAPNCSDGIQNGEETGVDCGGFCGACPVPETCTDGLKNQNETDVDCGGVCGACPLAETCNDGIRNQNETGVDCGGVCGACPPIESCSDGIKNRDETGVDCGGVCPICPIADTCNDGILNQNETGVDCGGVCGACPPIESCSDGIKNRDETGIDCGGVCPICPVVDTCDDGILNQNETGVDCGGVCGACPALIFKVTLEPENKTAWPDTIIQYSARSYLDDKDVTDETQFTFTLRDGGAIERQAGNDATLKAGRTAGVFSNALTVLGSYKTKTGSAKATFEVLTPVTPPGCTGDCIETKPDFLSTIRGLGENAATNPLSYIFATLLGALALIPQTIHFTRDLMAPFAKGKDKRHTESLVYDSVTGLPQAGVRVMLIEKDLNTLISMAVTGSDGRYALDVSPGKLYEVRAEKPGFAQFTNEKSNFEKAGLRYTNNYFGEAFAPHKDEFVFNKNIPLLETDPEMIAKEIIRKSRINSILISLNVSIMLLGVGLTVIILAAFPTTMNFLILALYVLSLLLFLSRILVLRGRDYGLVVNLSEAKKPVDLAVIRAIQISNEKLAKTVVSDMDGKFTLTLPRGEYKLHVGKRGLTQHNPLRILVKNSFYPRHDEIGLDIETRLEAEGRPEPLVLNDPAAKEHHEAENTDAPAQPTNNPSDFTTDRYNTHPGSADEIIENYHLRS